MTAYKPVPEVFSREIREVNLSYLMLCQQLLREDFATGLYLTGLSEETGQVLLSLSPSQLVAISSTTVVLVAFRLNDASLLSALAENPGILQKARSAMVLAQSQPACLQAGGED